MKTDVVIIGAGPAGIFTAIEMLRLGSKKKIIIVEKGQPVEKRRCPKIKTGKCMNCKPYCHITTGFSGAGAFSDGKLSLSVSVGGDLPSLVGEDLAQETINYTDKIYLEFGADEHVEGLENTEEIKQIRTRAIRAGDTVELLKFGSRATVLSVTKDGNLELQAGIMKLTAKPDEVALLEDQPQGNAKKIIEHKARELKAAASPELDIRGMAADEAMPVLDQFLDSAYLANLPSVRIIHGKGTGVLRAAVHDELRRCKYVKSFRLGVYGEGESGVTIVEFK